MDTLSLLYSEGGAAVGGGRVYSVIVRPRDDGSFLAVCKLDAGARGLLVCYGGGDTPSIALHRLLDATRLDDRWRKDKLERAPF
jgi:hypothetical protein